MISERVAKLIRVATVPPAMALVLLAVLYAARREVFGSPLNLVLAIFFLVALPLLAYPLQPLLPSFRDRGREGQRSLAMWMASAGYVLGLVAALVFPVSGYLLVIYLTYLLSGVFIVLLDKVFKIKASGHACGVAGPVISLIYFLGPWMMFGLLLLPAVYWASLTIKRHDKSELLIGTAVPTYALLLALLIVLGYRPI